MKVKKNRNLTTKETIEKIEDAELKEYQPFTVNFPDTSEHEYLYICGGITEKQLLDFCKKKKEITIFSLDLSKLAHMLTYKIPKNGHCSVFFVHEVKNIGRHFSHSQRFKPNPVLIRADCMQNEYMQCKKRWQIGASTSDGSFLTVTGRVKEWMTNVLQNCAADINYRTAANIYKQKHDALLCAAGPSLTSEKSLKVLKHWGGLVFAVSHAVKPLLKHGVDIDYITILESKDFSSFLPDDVSNFRFICSSTTHPNTIQKNWKEVIMVGDLNPLVATTFLEITRGTASRVHPGPSVANFQLKIAEQLGIRGKFLIGQDLANKDGKTHAEGAEQNDQSSDVASWLGKDRKKDVRVTHNFIGMLKYFETQSENVKSIYDISAYGAAIPGIMWLDSDDLEFEKFPDEKFPESTPKIKLFWQEWKQAILGIIDEGYSKKWHTCAPILAFCKLRERISVKDIKKAASELHELLKPL